MVLPLCVVVLALATRIPEAPRDSVASIDVVGAVLAVVALGGVTFALIEGADGGWTSLEIAAGVLGLAAGCVALVYEPRVEHPMVPVDLFSIRPFTAANVITFLVYGGMGVVFFLLPLQLQVVAGWSPIEAGMALIPVTVTLLFLSSRAGDLAQRIGPRLPLTVGPLVMAAGTALLAMLGPDATFATVLPGVVVFGLGLAAAVAPVTSTALGSVPDERAGAASGTNNAIARTGQLLAIAAVPGLAGLTGGALADAAELDEGYPTAMLIGGALVAAGGLAAAILLRSTDARVEPAVRTPRSCPVDGAPLGVGAARHEQPD
ncbi:MAG TPA: MFS transporter, partial [Ilumatobacteraceae bacterium]